MIRIATRLVTVIAAVFLPTVAFAQASIAGVVRDTSGAVLPGVTVEAASPALIEKVRSVQTDGSGQYKIEALRPGAYSVTFTLAGFTAVKRAGVELAGSFAATVNAELVVGGVAETLTVTGESPIVDVQNTKLQRVIDHSVIDAVPSGRSAVNMAVLIPSVTGAVGAGAAGVTQDVGGSLGDAMLELVAHGSRSADMRMNLEGLMTNNDAKGSMSGFQPNMSATQEVNIDIGAAPADTATGGVRMNLIPKEGGNIFTGTMFATGYNSSFQGSNYTPALQARGFVTPNTIKSGYDLNPGVGGPLKRDVLWFFLAARRNNTTNYVGGMFNDQNAGNPKAFTYAPNKSQPTFYPQDFHGVNARVTWQATAKNKFSFYYDDQYRCQCPRATGTVTAEAAPPYREPLQRFLTASYTAPLTSRLLVEVAIGERGERWSQIFPPGGPAPFNYLPGAMEQSSGLAYRNQFSGANSQLYVTENVRASLSYVTGSHAFKVGMSDIIASDDILSANTDLGSPGNPAAVGYRFNNGIPNQITEYAKPVTYKTNQPGDLSFYLEDKWTTKRLTANLGVRYEGLNIDFPAECVGPTPNTPNRNVCFPYTPWTNWKDVMPRLGVAYDLFGNGKTALKFSANKYMVQQTVSGVFGASGNPVNLLATTVTRSWNDGNGNFFPDCNLLSPLANGECGAMSDQNFGNSTKTTAYDPKLVSGWGVRPYDWEFAASVQQQLTSRISANIGFFRRVYGNFQVTDNLAVSASDFSPYSIPAPLNPGLPGGGGYAISGLYNLNPNKVGQVSNFVTSADNFGSVIEHWNGVDLSVTSRLPQGILLQGGLSTGVQVSDDCAIAQNLALSYTTGAQPLSSGTVQSTQMCHEQTPFLTQVKGYGAYTLPKVDVQLSATFQSVPGPLINANYVAPNALIAPSLGRSLSGGAANATVNLVSPGTLFGERMNELDFRLARTFRFHQTRTTLNLDVYNVFNSNAVLVQNDSFAVWQTPLATLMARFAKISAQFNF